MKVYESVCIASPSLSDEEITKLTEKITETIARTESSLIKIVNDGKKKLAYDIKHERRGTYLIVHFEGKGNAVSELERFYRMDDAIMKFLTVEIPASQANASAESTESTESTEKEEVLAGDPDGRVQ